MAKKKSETRTKYADGGGEGTAGRMFSVRGPNDGYSYYIKHKRIEETEKCVRLKNFVLHPSASSEHKGFAFSDAKAIKWLNRKFAIRFTIFSVFSGI